MNTRFDRPNQQMRDQIDTALRQVASIGRQRAAAVLDRAGVPLPVICRVLDARGRRRSA